VTWTGWTADLLDPAFTRTCGCRCKRIPIPVGGVVGALEVIEPCETHKGDS
jgi:hypothetical protein